MGRKPRRNKSARKPTAKVPTTKAEAALVLLEAKIERKTQAEILKDLLVRHHGDIPVPVLWEQRAVRLQGAISG